MVLHKDIQQLFKRMVFNIVFRNVDDHLKNHSFIYDKSTNSWGLAPAYGVTYALNPLLTFRATSRALSIHGKRTAITLKDVLTVAEAFAIKNPKGVVAEVRKCIPSWAEIAGELGVPQNIKESIAKDIIQL